MASVNPLHQLISSQQKQIKSEGTHVKISFSKQYKCTFCENLDKVYFWTQDPGINVVLDVTISQ